ncbi:MAG: hypothetical protein IRY99_25740, partial [Isosphaeraceae bacterium]|nr:hypothetical protein [Isosphaeraceae bacterium]
MPTVLVALLLLAQADDGEPLSLADLPAYRQALEATPLGAAVPVTFRDLWDDPAAYRGRRVRVEGRVARRFRQGAVGQLPALSELWIATNDKNLICSVFPTGTGAIEL